MNDYNQVLCVNAIVGQKTDRKLGCIIPKYELIKAQEQGLIRSPENIRDITNLRNGCLRIAKKLMVKERSYNYVKNAQK